MPQDGGHGPPRRGGARLEGGAERGATSPAGPLHRSRSDDHRERTRRDAARPPAAELEEWTPNTFPTQERAGGDPLHGRDPWAGSRQRGTYEQSTRAAAERATVARMAAGEFGPAAAAHAMAHPVPVSYTHLTLPTILLV
eukprot:9481317-Pyramimonas_sp.AAC.1